MKTLLRWTALAACALFAAAALADSVFFVKTGQRAAITQLGLPVKNGVVGPGLHFKAPFIQKAHRFAYDSHAPSFDNSLILAPMYVNYLADSEEKFREEAAELKRRLGAAKHVLLGFSAFIHLDLPAVDLNRPLPDGFMRPVLAQVDTVVERAKANGLVTHISIVSGFFHGWNALRESAIRQDVRNAQWFADGWIAPEADLKDPSAPPRTAWITPSRYAFPLRARVEEAIRILGRGLAGKMAASPETLVTVGGDGETELTYERNFLGAAEQYADRQEVIYADYSPFMVAEFRDWLRAGYEGDLSPATDENGDGRVFNRDYRRDFRTWRLRYYDASGPIPFAEYFKMKEKLPESGAFFIDGGFDAPRRAAPDDPLWEAWLRFRRQAVANWVRDFAYWITTSPDPATGYTIPPARYYSHQIPADYLFGKPDNLRLQTSASPVETAFIHPSGSPGVTAFNVFNGYGHSETADPPLFSKLFTAGDHWGVLEYNPSMPRAGGRPSSDDAYYLEELHELYAFRPHLIIPFAWSDIPHHQGFNIKNSPFERALSRFVQEAGDAPWFSWRKLLNE